ncbi:CPBP family intramembrane metalloprotease [bacterium AH-315-C07]|nr:CPBP family intramembrane metalloprotease [bacterium AH-315-C07]
MDKSPATSTPTEDEPFISRNKFLLICIVFTAGLIALAWAIEYFINNSNIFKQFGQGVSTIEQMLWGTLLGICGSFGILSLYKLNFFKDVKSFFAELIQEIRLKTVDIFFISLCAGISEELLFRGVAQQWLGIWVTSLLFVALHGYLNPANIRLCVLGTILVVFSSGIGYLYEYFGIISAITAHAVFDIVLLYYFVKILDEKKKSNYLVTPTNYE